MYQFIVINDVWVNKDMIAEIEFQPAKKDLSGEYLDGYLFRMKDKDDPPRFHPLKDAKETKMYEEHLRLRL